MHAEPQNYYIDSPPYLPLGQSGESGVFGVHRKTENPPMASLEGDGYEGASWGIVERKWVRETGSVPPRLFQNPDNGWLELNER